MLGRQARSRAASCCRAAESSGRMRTTLSPCCVSSKHMCSAPFAAIAESSAQHPEMSQRQGSIEDPLQAISLTVESLLEASLAVTVWVYPGCAVYCAGTPAAYAMLCYRLVSRGHHSRRTASVPLSSCWLQSCRVVTQQPATQALCCGSFRGKPGSRLTSTSLMRLLSSALQRDSLTELTMVAWSCMAKGSLAAPAHHTQLLFGSTNAFTPLKSFTGHVRCKTSEFSCSHRPHGPEWPD